MCSGLRAQVYCLTCRVGPQGGQFNFIVASSHVKAKFHIDLIFGYLLVVGVVLFRIRTSNVCSFHSSKSIKKRQNYHAMKEGSTRRTSFPHKKEPNNARAR